MKKIFNHLEKVWILLEVGYFEKSFKNFENSLTEPYKYRLISIFYDRIINYLTSSF